MRDGDVVREIMAKQQMTLVKLAEECGYSSQSAIGNRIRSDGNRGMTTKVLAKLLEVLDCELIIRDREGNEWKID